MGPFVRSQQNGKGVVSQMDNKITESAADGYEAPELTEFGSIEEWTKGQYAEAINLSVIL